MAQEIWKDIAGYDGLYQVSNMGNIKSLRGKKQTILKNIVSMGYCQTNLCKNSKCNTIRIHRLVAQAFIINKYNKPFINHINGDKSDNRAENLEWCTHNENVQHAYKLGLNKNYCENHYNAKLTNNDVIEILNSKMKQRDIAKKYSVNERIISAIKRGKRYNKIQIK